MKHFFTSLLQRVEAEIRQIQAKPASKEAHATQCCIALCMAYRELQNFLSTYTFSSEQEEIDYFKLQKPEICSQLMYYREIRHIEINKPRRNVRARKNYLLAELSKLECDFKENNIFVNYYRSGEKAMDRFYFTRHQMDFKAATERFPLDRDFGQSTNYDSKVAELLTNELLQAYLEGELTLLEAPNVQEVPAARSVKIQSGLTVAQMALFFRLQTECELVTHKVSQEIFEHIATSYQSPKATSISSASILNKYYTFDDATLRAVEGKLLEMLSRLKEL